MKNIIKHLFLLSMLFGIVGCSSDDMMGDDLLFDDQSQEQSGEVFQITATIASGDANDTKVAINDYSVTWEEGDVMQIFAMSDAGVFIESNITFTINNASDISEDGKSATFTGSGLVADTEYVAFTGGATMTFSDGKVTTNLQSVASLEDIDLLMVSDSFELSTLDGGMVVTFENKCSIFQVEVSDTSSTGFTASSAEMKSTGNIYSYMSYSVDGTVESVKESATTVETRDIAVKSISPNMYIPVYCNDATADLTLSVYNAEKTQYATKSYSDVELSNGLIYDAVTMEVTSSNLFTELATTYVENETATSTILEAVTSASTEEATITSKDADGNEVEQTITATIVTVAATDVEDVLVNQAVVSDVSEDGEMEIVVVKAISDTDASGNVELTTAKGNITNLFRDTEFTLGGSGETVDQVSMSSKIYTPSEVGVVMDGVYTEVYNTRAYEQISASLSDVSTTLQATGVSATLSASTFNIGLDYNISFQFGRDLTYPEECRGELEAMSCYFWGTLDMDLLTKYVASATGTIADDITLKTLDAITMTYYIDDVPIAIKITPSIHASADFSISGVTEETTISTECSIAGNVNMGVKYVEGSSSSIYSYFDNTANAYSNYSFSSIDPGLTIKSANSVTPAAKSSIETRFDISFYGLAGPSISFMPYVGVRNTSGTINYDGATYYPFKSETSAGIYVDATISGEFVTNDATSELWSSYSDSKNIFDEEPSEISLVSPSESESLTPTQEVEVVFETSEGAVVKFTDQNGALLGYGTADADGVVSYTWTAVSDGVVNASVIDDEQEVVSAASYSPIVAYNDRELLVAIYEANGGVNWSYADNWNTTAPIADWEGVTTNASGRVTELSFVYITDSNENLPFGLTGTLDITGFDELTSLNCNYNTLTAIDASSGCTKLQTLNANYNLNSDNVATLTSVDLTGVDALVNLQISNNNISSENVSKLNLAAFSESMNTLSIGYSPSEIDYSMLENLTTFNADYNENITTFDFSNHPNVEYLTLNGCSKLEEIENVDQATSVNTIACCYNPLTELDLSGCNTIEYVYTHGSQNLTKLYLEGCSSLIILLAYDCALEDINLSGCISLKEVFLFDNNLTTLDASDTQSITSFYVSDNQLEVIQLYQEPESSVNFDYTSWGDVDSFLYGTPSHIDSYQYPLFVYTSNGVTLQESGAEVAYEASSITINPIITADTYEVSTSADWATITVENDEVTATYAANETGAKRTAYITFTSGDYSESYTLIQDYERVQQLEDLEIEVLGSSTSIN